MPSNLLIFDAEYVSELTSRMNLACDLMAEAVSSLKNASAHENWKCKERTRILDDFDELNLKLGRLDEGVNETTRILGGSVSRFAALESQYDSQANGLSDELTSNHGYAASVRTDEPSGEISQPGENSAFVPPAGQAQQNAEADNSAQTGAAAGAAGAAGAGAAGGHHGAGGGHGTGAASAVAGRIAGRGRPGHHGPESGQESQTTAAGGAAMNVNLPVTHIPDSPDAAAKGIKDTKAIADAAVSFTVRTIAVAFVGETAGNIEALAEAYNTGRSIFENSAVIMAAPAQAHTTERLAMAAGIVSLAGNSQTGFSGFAQAAGVTASYSSSSSFSASGEGFRRKAMDFMSAAQGNSEAGELRNVFGVLAGTDSEVVQASGSGSGKRSFFDMIVSALKKAISGEESGSSSSSMFSASSASSSSASSLSGSSPVADFLNKFVMDQV